MLLSRTRTPAGGQTPPVPARRGGALLHGVVAQGANPKALLFFVALLPQFVRADLPLAPQIAVLAVTSIVIEMAALATYAALAARARRVATGGAAGAVLRRVGGALMLGAGLGMATMEPPAKR